MNVCLNNDLVYRTNYHHLFFSQRNVNVMLRKCAIHLMSSFLVQFSLVAILYADKSRILTYCSPTFIYKTNIPNYISKHVIVFIQRSLKAISKSYIQLVKQIFVFVIVFECLNPFSTKLHEGGLQTCSSFLRFRINPRLIT